MDDENSVQPGTGEEKDEPSAPESPLGNVCPVTLDLNQLLEGMGDAQQSFASASQNEEIVISAERDLVTERTSMADADDGEMANGEAGSNTRRTHRFTDMDHEFINEFIALFRRAVEADQNQDYSSALELYKVALRFGLALLKPTGPGCTWSEMVKNQVRSKLTEYMDRAESIKRFVMAQQSADPVRGNRSRPASLPAPGGLTSLMLQCRQEFLVKPNVRWNDIVGLNYAKDKLKEWVILPLKFPQLFTGERMPMNWGNILFYGPPGCAKTQLAWALAAEVENATVFHVSTYALAADQYGNRKVDALFELAQLHKPCFIVLDDLDYLCRSNLSRQILMSLVIRLSGRDRHRSPETKVVVIACSHSPDKLWPCVRRRFPWRLYLKPPDLETRAGIIENNLKGVAHDLSPTDMLDIAARTKGWAGSDLVTLTRGAAMGSIRKLSDAAHFIKTLRASLPPTISTDGAENPSEYVYVPCSPDTEGAIETQIINLPPEEIYISPVCMEDFRRELGKCGCSIDKEQLEKTEEFHKEFGTNDECRKKKGDVSSLKSQSRRSLLQALAPVFKCQDQGAAAVCQEYDVIHKLPLPRSLQLYLLAESSDDCL